MKKLNKAIAMLLMATVMVSSAGCSIVSEQTDSSETTTQATYLVGSPGQTDDFEFGVTDIKSFDVVTDYGETMHYLLVSVSYTNLSDKEQDISKRNIELYLDNEEIFSCEYRSEFADFFEEGLLFNDKKVHPGRTKRGFIVYRIYRDFSSINVCMDGITISAAEDEVTPLVQPADVEATDQTCETTPETIAPTPILTPIPTPIPTPVETVVATETTVESVADSVATESVPTE